MYGWGGDSWGMGGWIVMAVLMVLFWGGVITLVIVVLLRRPRSDQGTTALRPSHHDAERILNERFARGEIDETEYLARRTALRRPE
ncbi:SHOCT domain-containing protein [Cryobacterium psychrophilum]|uniref:SHOCT domain-containing protein n=1 Tax=Cryobacterium psychrophilum TaxID=41988 RepID=A0A4Y8KSS8_9MICO|nr:SHOCT domain-containing protein [Cryobacterium psychrophilum]TDW29762.1 putative membrane protein [Cryobacterium psychrophilum]TFD81921.1 SHOCT domain-containing protein [Cryobacterium psychrophilum]